MRKIRVRFVARDGRSDIYVNGQLTIPLTQVSDGDLHRYEAKENGSGHSILVVSEAGWKDCHGIRRMQNLRSVWFLQDGERGGVQELRVAGESAVGGVGRGMQSDSAEGDADGGCGDYSRGGRRGGEPRVREAINVCPAGVRIFPAARNAGKLLAGAAITLGVTVATAMIAVATDIGDKINREL